LHKVGVAVSVTVIGIACYVLYHMLRNIDTFEVLEAIKSTEHRSIALAAYPRAGAVDEAAEREMALMQEMITAARQIRADNEVDKKVLLAGVLYCRNGASKVELPVIEKLAAVKLDIRTGNVEGTSGAVRSTPGWQSHDFAEETSRPGIRARPRWSASRGRPRRWRRRPQPDNPSEISCPVRRVRGAHRNDGLS